MNVRLGNGGDSASTLTCLALFRGNVTAGHVSVGAASGVSAGKVANTT